METVNDVRSCIQGPASKIPLEPSECHCRPPILSPNDAMVPTGTTEETSASALPLDAQSNSSVKIVNDARSCIPGPPSEVPLEASECHETPPTPLPNDAMVLTGTTEEFSASALPLDAQSNSSVETVNDVLSFIPGPSTEIPSEYLKCHDRPPTRSLIDAMVLTGTIEKTIASALPLDAQSNSSLETVNDVRSCISGPPTRIPPEPSECHDRPPTPSPNDSMVPTGTTEETSASTLLLDAQSNSSVEIVNDMRSCIPGLPSKVPSEPSECPGRPPTPSPNDAMVPTGTTEETSAPMLPLDAQSSSSVETVSDALSCIPGLPSKIPSGPSECHGRPPTQSPNNAAVPTGTVENTSASTLPFDAKSNLIVEAANDVRSCLPEPPSKIPLESSEYHGRPPTPSSNDAMVPTGTTEETSASPLGLYAQSNSSVETVNDVRSFIPRPPSKIPSENSECHTTPLTPSPTDAMVRTGAIEKTSASALPLDARFNSSVETVNNVRSCIPRPPSKIALEALGCHRPPTTSPNDAMVPTGTTEETSASALPLDGESNSSVETVNDVCSCIPALPSSVEIVDDVRFCVPAPPCKIRLEPSECHGRPPVPSAKDAMVPTETAEETSTSAVPLDAQSNSSVEMVKDVRPCISGLPCKISLKPSECHGRTLTPSPNDAMVPTETTEETSPSAVPLETQSNSSKETVDDLRSCISGLPCEIPLEPSECHGRPSTPSPNDAMAPTGTTEEISASAVPLEAQSNSSMETVNDVRSCIPGPDTKISLEPSECHGRPSTPSPNDTKVPSGTTEETLATALPLDVQSNTSVDTLNDMSSCILGLSTKILSGPSECHGRQPTPSPNDSMVPTGTIENPSASALPLDARSNSSEEIVDDMRFCVPGLPCKIPLEPSECHGRLPVPSTNDAIVSTETAEETSTFAVPLDAQSNSSVEAVNDVRPCISGLPSKISLEPSKCHVRTVTPSPNDAMVPSETAEETSACGYSLEAQSNSSVENVNDVRSCIPGPPGKISLETSECHGRPLTPSPNDSMVHTGTNEETSASAVPLEAQSNSSVETVNYVRSCIPGLLCETPLEPSECHGGPPAPLLNDAMVPTGTTEETSASALPLDAQSKSRVETVNDVRSCIPLEPSECHIRPPAPSLNDVMAPTGTTEETSATAVPLDAQSNSSAETVNDMQSFSPGPPSKIPSEPLECHGRLPTPSPNDAIVSTGTIEKTSASALPLDARSNSSEEIVDDMRFCVPGPPCKIPLEPSECHGSLPVPSTNDAIVSTETAEETSTFAVPLDAQSNSSVEAVNDVRPCILGLPSKISLEPSKCHVRMLTPSPNDAMVPTETAEETSACGLSLEAQSNSSVENVNDVRSCIPGPPGKISLETSECHGRSLTPSPNDSMVHTGTNEETSASAVPLEAQSNSSVETVNYVRSCIPGLLCETPLEPSKPLECHGRPPAPSLNDAMVPTGTTEETSASALPLDAQSKSRVETVNDMRSCIPLEPSECHIRPPAPSLNDVMAPTGTTEETSATAVPLDAQFNSSAETVNDMQSFSPGPPSKIPSEPLECHGRLPTPSPNDAMVSTGTTEETSASAQPLDAQSNSSVETVNDMHSFIPGPSSKIPPGPLECHGRLPTPSPTDAMVSTGTTEETSASALPLDTQSNSSSVVDCQTGAEVTADCICEISTNVEGSCVVTTITETPSVDASSPSGSNACQTISSLPTSVSGSAVVRPLMSIAATPPAIPSLMSIQITPPPWWNDYAFGPRFPTPHRYPMPRNNGASRPHRHTSSTHGGAPVRQLTPLMDIQSAPPTPIPALMSNQTSPPPDNGIRPLADNGNGRGVPAPSEIPPLMSIQTRPPWGRSRPPRGSRPSRGTRRPQGRG